MVEDEEHEIESEEEEILDEDLELIDIIITKHPKKKDQIHLSDFFPFLQIFDNRLVESFVEPDFSLDEDVDSLYTEVNEITQNKLLKTKISGVKTVVNIIEEEKKLKDELENCEIEEEEEEDDDET